MLEALKTFCEEAGISFKTNEPMRNHTSFKIGGNADIFITVKSLSELSAVLRKTNELGVKRFLLGKGSNILVSDKGIEGAVISLAEICAVTAEGETLTAGAGASLSQVCRAAAENSLSGLEFAYGIPGSVGGAVYMNAGAYGGETADVTVSADYMTPNGDTGSITAAEMRFGYRSSVFKNNGYIITGVKFKLKKSDKALIEAAMEDYINRRKTKQPLEYPSAGSTFKRPEGYFAGALIEKNGLKGFSVGGAQVSEKHAGFIINRDNASCEDVKQLSEKIKETVLKNDGVKLETEVIFVGRD